MPLLTEYALTPDVFDPTSYSSEEVCALHLQAVKDVLLTEGLVRDLRDGEWHRLFATTDRSWHRRAKEIVRKLADHGRLARFPATLPSPPTHDQEWCAEALGTHRTSPLSGGIIVTQSVKAGFEDQRLVARVDRLAETPWWTARSPSTRLARTNADYQTHLEPILRCANSIMFIDPHLDPTRYGYRDFVQLLLRAGGRTPSPLLEIHRVCYEGSGPGRQILTEQEIEQRFRDELAGQLRAAGARVEVYVWDDFHDRYLVSNLIGLLMSNGFDAGGGSPVTWARLGRKEKDDVQREFDPASGCHALRTRFTVP
jgi:hypothetical protein